MDDPLASIVIPVSPDSELLGQCLDRVGRQDFRKKEVIVVCDPRAGELASLPEGSEELRVIRQRRPSGLDDLINSGMRAARGHVKILLMPHCIPVGNGWLRSMVEPFECDDVGVVVSQCLALDGSNPGLAARLLDSVDPQQRRSSESEPVPQQVVSHVCDAYRASLLADVGYFQADGLAEPGQAIDMSLKVADAGYTILLSNKAVASHNIPPSRRRLAAVLTRALRYGYSDALLDKLYQLRWLNAGVFAAAFFSLFLPPAGALSLPWAFVLSFALFSWGAVLTLRVPLLGWECPLAAVNFMAYVALMLLVSGDWLPGLFGRDVHPSVVRQWCWLTAITGSCVLLVAKAALTCAVRACRRPRGWLYAVPVFALGVVWWLLTGIGYLRAVLTTPSRKD